MNPKAMELETAKEIQAEVFRVRIIPPLGL